MTTDVLVDFRSRHEASLRARRAAYSLGCAGVAVLRSLGGSRLRLPDQVQRIETLLDQFRGVDGDPEDFGRIVPAEEGYGTWAPTYDGDNVENPQTDVERTVIRELVGSAPADARVVDVACGTGRNVPVLQELGYRVTGVDLTPEMLEVARTNHPAATFTPGRFTDLPLPDASVDLVFTALALTHEPDLDAAVAEFARVLRPAGKIVLLDAHPYQVLLGSHATVETTTESLVVKNHVHLASHYLDACRAAGLVDVQLREPAYEQYAAVGAAQPVNLQAEDDAFRGTPALIAVSARKPGDR